MVKAIGEQIQEWCERKHLDVKSLLSTDSVDIYVHAYTTSSHCEWVACDFFACGDVSKVADTTFSFGDDTNLDDLYCPQIKDIVTLFEFFKRLEEKFETKINFGMPDIAECVYRNTHSGLPIITSQN